MILNDIQILQRCTIDKMITPFVDGQVRTVHGEKIVSYGLSSFGYDMRVGSKYKIFHNAFTKQIDPKNFKEDNYLDFEGPVCIVPPNGFVLAESVEYFKMPNDILAICLGKSTYARCGIIINVTPLEPEWEGILTLEISNTTSSPALIYSNEGIAQLIFLEGRYPSVTYRDRNGKYQGQRGVTTARL